MKPTVVQVLTRLGAGGPPINTLLLTRELSKLGYSSMLVTGSKDRDDGDMSYLLREGDTVHSIPEMSRSVSPWQDLLALIALYRFLKREQPSIVHTHTAKAGVIERIAARLAGVPVVIHTFHGNVFTHYFSRPVSWAVRLVERILAHYTDGICVLAPQQASELDHYHIGTRRKVHTIPLGMDLSALNTMAPAQHAPGAITVGWLGRLVPIKDVPLLIAVVRETLRRSDRIRFVVAGDGPEAPSVAALAAELGPAKFDFLGWREDVGPVLAQCDVLIQTSLNEGTPVALIQGMAAGRPFLSTPAGGVVNMVSGIVRQERNGCCWFDNGVLADPTPEAFASALCEMADNPDRIAAMGKRGIEFTAGSHSLPVMLQSLDALYSALLVDKEAGAGPRNGKPFRERRELPR